MACLLLQIHWNHSVCLVYIQHCCITCKQDELIWHSTDIQIWQSLLLAPVRVSTSRLTVSEEPCRALLSIFTKVLKGLKLPALADSSSISANYAASESCRTRVIST